MPVQQITVVPARESGHGKGAPHSKDSAEGSKTPGRSGSRSSNISKASNSGLTAATRVSISPSSQDICSSGHLARLEEDADTRKPNKLTPAAAASSTGRGSSLLTQKKQVKRRHRRERSFCSADCVGPKREQAERSDRSLSSERSEPGEKRERASRNRRELAPRLRCASAQQSDSSSEEEEEARRKPRSWSKEKARRARRRSGGSRERDGTSRAKAEEEKTEVMVLQSVDSDEGRENRPAPEGAGGLKRRHNGQASVARDGPSSQSGNKSSRKSPSPEDTSSLAEDSEELVTKYQEKGSGGGDMSVPAPQKACGMNGSAAAPYSDDSEMEVCRICHCEGDDDCPLIMPCRCTGSLSFVHQGCLNQWIKSSDTRCCELCKFDFVMETKLKPLRKWEKLHMTKGERRKIFCSVFFHLLAIVCMLWSVYILAKRTAEEIRLGKNEEFWRVSLLKYHTPKGVLEWPFWTKLIVVAIGFTGGLIFMYIQCKVYLQLWRRLKAFNRIITVQNCPEKGLHAAQARTGAADIGRHETTEAPASPAPAGSETSAEGMVAPPHNPV